MTEEKKQKDAEKTSKIQIGDIIISGLTDDKMVEAYRFYTNSMKVKYICISVIALVVVVRVMFFKF